MLVVLPAYDAALAPFRPWLRCRYNLVPSTIGNYIGGGVCLATVYAFAFGRTPKLVGEWVDQKMKRH